ncbi:50S ribosome-binding GTPase [Jeotgalibaca sp. MA1X17-3]|uniref:YcjF family protein n=1 Tax=Jeotgalibaca sp. MA1X17-3 TaxID=2908211 RepID=UPI001F47057D|nr:GTPase [Jeotgalibaca sp. MA1X17-3]UJF16131.1 50S ribosome-binding GTPase [Jeotgalibaca sp. MA1X17-3]
MMKGNVDFTLVEEMLNKTKEEIEKMSPVNVMLVGKTGVGKSTLVNNVFRERLASTGIGKPITKHLRKIEKEGIPIVLYDTRGLELSTEVQSTVRKEIFEAIHINHKKGPEKAIHVIYYCINANSSRIEESEIDFINELSELLPVIIVLTQSMGKPAETFRKYIEELNLKVMAVVTVMAEPYLISSDVTIPRKGLKQLIELTFEVIPEEAKLAFNNAQQVDIQRKARAARSWATRYIATTFGVGFTPIPFSDATILVPMQIAMMSHITAIFGISMDKTSIASILSAIGGTSGATYVGRYLVSNLIKFIPGAGTIAGGIISGATASVLTTALAMSYIEVLSFIAKGEVEGTYPDLKNIGDLMRERLQVYLKQSEETSITDSTVDEERTEDVEKKEKPTFFQKIRNTFTKK